MLAAIGSRLLRLISRRRLEIQRPGFSDSIVFTRSLLHERDLCSLYIWALRALSFSNELRAILALVALLERSANLVVHDNAMQISSERHTSVALNSKLRSANHATPELMAGVLKISRRRVLVQGHRERALRLKYLIDAGAWIDAALALIELELPLWHVRRIAYDGGEWHCALSRQPELPDWLDEAIEARHSDLALAILIVFVEAHEKRASFGSTSVSASTGRSSLDCIPLCCDNFA